MLVSTAENAATELTILAPMSLESFAARSAVRWARVRRIGIGPRRAAHGARAVAGGGGPLLLAGFCGALDDRLRAGDVVVASEVRTDGSALPCPDPAILAGALRRAGLRVWNGPVESSHRLVRSRRRRELARAGGLAVDMESAAVLQAAGDQPVFVLRVVLDSAHDELHRPARAARATVRAWRSLRLACAALEDWARSLGPREIVLASPRASCAGVERAVQVVERAIDHAGPPVYVRKQIVHNAHVISDLERRGAVFVDEVDEVPPGSTVIFSAHGVSPEVRRRAGERDLQVIDATCPLVAKVHAEARRFSASGHEIVLVGHEGHEEVEGTFGEAPERTHVVASTEEVERLQLRDPSRVAYLTQTTLAIDDTEHIVDALRDRFPEVKGPRSSDICYATQNRQEAVREVASECELVFVIGSENSSNSRRLVEVAERAGARALLIDDGSDIAPELLVDARRIGLTAGASAPEALVEGVLSALSALGPISLSERRLATEDIRFKLPVQSRGRV